MKNKSAVLEYCVAGPDGRERKWGFRFKTSDGQTLIQSAQEFDSRALAEQGFVAMIKSIAANDYTINLAE